MIQADKKIAVLIDAENTQVTALSAIMAEMAKYGDVIVKRAYGDWVVPALKNWKINLNELAIQPIQQFAYTKGKNSSDAALIIDAMDLLYSDKFDAFALISSDSDFTKLASRLKESKIYVYGVGKQQTPSAFINACDDFLYIENLKTLDADADDKNQGALPLPASKNAQNSKNTQNTNDLKTTQNTQPINNTKPKSANNQYNKQALRSDTKLISILRNAAAENSDEDNWAMMGVCGNFIKRQYSDFSPKNYGYAKLSALIRATELFEIRQPDNAPMSYKDTKRSK